MQLMFQVFGFAMVTLGIFGYLLMQIDSRLREELQGYFLTILLIGIVFKEIAQRT